MYILIFHFDLFRLLRNILKYVYKIFIECVFVIGRCNTLTITVDKIWFNGIKNYYEKISVNICYHFYLATVESKSQVYHFLKM